MNEGRVADIIKSGATVWTAPLSEALPAKSLPFGADWGGNWDKFGLTKEPLTFAYEQEEAEIVVEEYLAPVDRKRIAESAMAETVLSEFSAQVLRHVMGQGAMAQVAAGASQVAYEELQFGNEVEIEKRIWGFEGQYLSPQGEQFPVRWFLYRGTCKLNGELEFSRKSDDYVGIPMQVAGLADPDRDGRLWGWYRVLGKATSQGTFQRSNVGTLER
jgi:hypothetical protein